MTLLPQILEKIGEKFNFSAKELRLLPLHQFILSWIEAIFQLDLKGPVSLVNGTDKKLENCGTLSDIGQFRKKLQNFWKKWENLRKTWNGDRRISENLGKNRNILKKNWRISGKMGKFEGKSQKNFKWWWENLGKFEEKLENFDTNWKTSEKDGKFEEKLENFETKLEDLEKIQKSREKWETTPNETRKFEEKSEKDFWREK